MKDVGGWPSVYCLLMHEDVVALFSRQYAVP